MQCNDDDIIMRIFATNNITEFLVLCVGFSPFLSIVGVGHHTEKGEAAGSPAHSALRTAAAAAALLRKKCYCAACTTHSSKDIIS